MNKEILAVLVLGTLFVGFVPALAVSATGNTSCDIMHAVAEVPAPNTPAVFALLQSSSQFQAATAGKSIEYNGMSYESHADDLTCTVTPKAIDVEYVETAANGSQNALIFTVNVDVTRVLAITTEPAFYGTSCPVPSGAQSCTPETTLSGFQADYVSGGSNVEQFEATMNWVQPSVDFPANHGSSQPSCAGPCELLIWSGLYDGSTLLQAGTAGEAAYVSGAHIISYALWYEEYPSAASVCTSGDTAPTDSVESYVYSATLVGGSSGQWYLFAEDHTNSNICQPTNPVSNSFTPLWALFQAERPCTAKFFGTCLNQDSLPYFGTYSPEGRMYYSGAVHGLACSSCSQSVGYLQMQNGSPAVNNINCSGITDTGTGWGKFTVTWLTSQNT